MPPRKDDDAHKAGAPDDMDAQNRQAELNAQVVIARLIDKAKDPETANDVLQVWVSAADRLIGRTVRRLLWYLMIVLGGIVATKLGLLERLFPGSGK